MKSKICAALITLIFGITFNALGQEEAIRFKEGLDPAQDGELQIAVIEYERAGIAPNTTQTVILYGVVHVADQLYYNKVQKDLDSYDVVLYEGVKQGTDPNTGTKALNTLQKLMGDVLGLTFQKDGIDYNRGHFVHADVSIDELRKSLNGQPLDPFEQYISPELMDQLKPFLDVASEFIKMYMTSNPGFQDQLKVQFASQMAETDITAQMSPEMKKAILDDRNQIVQEILLRELKIKSDKKTFAIFYGAAHNPDFDARLRKLGFEKTSKRWMSAWTMGSGAIKDEEAPKKKKSEVW